MSKKTSKVIELDAVVVKFAGDSGDGIIAICKQD